MNSGLGAHEAPAALRDAVSALVAHVANALDGAPVTEDRYVWRRDDDDMLRRYTPRRPVGLSHLLAFPEGVVPGWDEATNALKAITEISSQLDRLIGTARHMSRIEGGTVVRSFVYAMISDDGTIAFDPDVFEKRWSEIRAFFMADTLPERLVAPLPGLTPQAFPLVLDDGVVLDRFTAREIDDCFSVGILRTGSESFPMLSGDYAVGLRASRQAEKVVYSDADFQDRGAPPTALDPGTFGRRPPFVEYRLLDDVLTALRLTLPGARFWSPGSVANGGSWASGTGGSYNARPVSANDWTFPSSVAISPADAAELRSIWHRLRDCGTESSKGARSVMYATSRFNSAFDRSTLEDQLVDLMIAAEGLLLADSREELSLRVAIRATTFIDANDLDQQFIYETMRTGYTQRSKIVHGDRPNHHDLGALVADVRTVMRAAILTAISETFDRSLLTSGAFWEKQMVSLWKTPDEPSHESTVDQPDEGQPRSAIHRLAVRLLHRPAHRG